MHSTRFVKIWAVAASMAATLAAQPVFIVDQAGGPGSHFTDLPPAVATVPDGSVLRIRPGNYSGFSVTGKSLAVVGEDRDRVVVQLGAPLSIAGLGPGQAFLLQSLLLVDVGVRGGSSLLLSSSPGSIAIVDVVTLGLTMIDTQVRGCSQVWFDHCVLGSGLLSSYAVTTLSASDSALQLSFTTVDGRFSATGMTLTRSRCVAVASRVLGGQGIKQGTICGAGQTGVVADDHTTWLALGCIVSGGAGFPCVFGFCIPCKTDGGVGIQVSNNSSADFFGGYLVGGPPNGTGSPGAAAVVDSTSVIRADPSAVPSAAAVNGILALGQPVTFDCAALPGSTAALVLAYDPTLIPIDPLTPGSFLAGFVATIGPAVVPSSGLLALSLTVPSGWPVGLTFHGQFVTMEPSGRLWVSNAFPCHVAR